MSLKPIIIIVTQEEYIALLQWYILKLCPYLNCSLRELLANISKKGHSNIVRCSVIVQHLAQSESLRVPSTPLYTMRIPPRSTLFVVSIHTGLIQTKHIVEKGRH